MFFEAKSVWDIEDHRWKSLERPFSRQVLPVSQGVRMALTAAFTCSKEKALSIEAAAVKPSPRSRR